MSYRMLREREIENRFEIKQNKVYYSGNYNSYIAADIAGFIREQLLLNGCSFSFETVFSHESKLEIMREARRLGYRVYFYFLTTDDPEINVNRVKVRVAKNGHPVPREKIVSRYYKSLEQLFAAVKLSNRAFLFDNSGRHYELVAEITDGKKVEITDYDKVIPRWFEKYIFQKTSQ